MRYKIYRQSTSSLNWVIGWHEQTEEVIPHFVEADRIKAVVVPGRPKHIAKSQWNQMIKAERPLLNMDNWTEVNKVL